MIEDPIRDMAQRTQAGNDVKRWSAERENADARLELARMREAMALLLTQHEPVASLNVNRDELRVLLNFVRHHDARRLAREVEELKGGSK